MILPLATIAGSLGVFMGMMASVRWAAGRLDMGAEVKRKLVDIGTGLYAMILPLLFAEDWPVYAILGGTLLIMALVRLPAFRTAGMGEALHSVERRSWGDFLFAIAVGLTFLWAEREWLIYLLPLAILTLSDAAAALAGSTYGRKFFTIEDGQKSVEGSTVFFLVSLLLSMIALLLFSDVSRENVILLSLLIAAFGTMVEADSWRGFDNLFLPVGVLIFLKTNLDSSTLALTVLGLVFGGALVVFHLLAPRLGITYHAARLYLVSLFLLLSITAMQNAVLPLLALALHAWAERWRPSEDPHPALDAVACVAILSFFWLAMGSATGMNALDHYGATMVALGAALAAISGLRYQLKGRILTALGVSIPLFLAWVWLRQFNPSDIQWSSHPEAMALAALIFAVNIVTLMGDRLQNVRMLKTGSVAVAVPTAAYMISWLSL